MHTENNTDKPTLTDHQANEATIKLFFSMYGEETHAAISEFLFDRMADFAGIAEWADDHKANSILHFKMLHDLVNGLQKPEGSA